MRERAFPFGHSRAENALHFALSPSIFSALWEMAGETIRFAYELEHKTESQPKQSGKPKGI